MNISINTSGVSATCRVYGIYENENLISIPADIKPTVEIFIKNERFKGESGEIYDFTTEIQGKIIDILLVGLGKKNELDTEKVRIAYARVIKKAKELKIKAMDINLFDTGDKCILSIFNSILEGICFANYKFNKYKTQKTKELLDEISIVNVPQDKFNDMKKKLEEAMILIEATLMARDLVNEPANVITPKVLAEKAKEVGKDTGFEVEVFDEEHIKALKMDAFLSVAQGSDNPPSFIVMRYFGDKKNESKILGLVGKGLTYDSGGYSIKPTDSMVNMKNDMGGSAAVIGALGAIAKMKLPINVVAVVAACENMISGKAYKPGDIISSMAGKTIEIMNTDAEGRLTLADAVYYIVEKEKATKVVDIATLTGAVVVGLGSITTGVLTNNEEFFGELKSAADKSGERVWQFPAFDDYKKLFKSDIADLKNTGGRQGGTITAGLFIGEFVQGKPWLHLDIAGTAWSDSDKEYLSKGGTGVGVRTLYYLAKDMI